MNLLVLLSALVATSYAACQSGGGKTCIQVLKNGGRFQSAGEKNENSILGFALDPKQSKDVYVQDRWTAGRIWARTGCDASMNCDTGFCKNSLQCSGAGGRPPASLAEFTLGATGAGNQDFYDVSMVDGYNLPIFIEPIAGTFNSNGGQYDCKRAGGCTQNLNDPKICPAELQLKNKAGAVVGCKSACLALNSDQYCCRGANGTPATCNPNTWPKNYAAIFKKACPAAYSYAYDDKTSTFTCRGKNLVSRAYKVLLNQMSM